MLIVGFVLSAGIWLGAGYFFSGRIGDLETDAAQIGDRYTHGQEILSEIRNHLYRGSLLVRDALLDEAGDMAEYRRLVVAAYGEANRALTAYEPVAETPTERDRVAGLRVDIDALLAATLDVLDAGGRGRAGDFLLMKIAPTRDAAIRVANELQELNREAYLAQQGETASLYRTTQLRFWETLGFGVLASLGIAILSGLHVGRLELGLRARQEADARTAEELHRLSSRLVSAQEEERRVIARELHDEIGQVLTVVKLELSHAQRDLSSRHEDVPTALTEARAAADRALQAVRDVSHVLHPPLLEDLGLVAALDWYVQSVERRHHLRMAFAHYNLAERLPAEVEVTLYRAIQEAVTNVLRHARAATCQITVSRTRDRVTASVADDGIGFSPEAAERSDTGLGLISIRERVAEARGRLRLESNPGRGSLLTVELPVPPYGVDDRASQELEPTATEAD